ncbi:fasciclin domain-containing protein [Sphingomicrobium sediminis]|uniref:Fasciclin domain-containing protein n=1 Tax=Sphingomicrobium sediminis TaxID=2950949 RepID=A0A9X2J3K7_9SPHN|nr:fasciclin domain-containing protein [Sphingomicrobium sediminis]MCM8558145.1 fasciclin domain-containing protein [Sphingomicrobium sediminis]
MKTRLIALAAALALPLAACGGNAPESVTEADADPGTLSGAIPADSQFAAAMEAAGLANLFDGPEPYTVLLPPDSAFPETLPEDAEAVAEIVTLHILPGTILAEDLVAALDQNDGSVSLPSYGGANLDVLRDGDAIRVSVGGNSVTLTPGEAELEDGAVHSIDGLLQPPA